jgi:hypothetical protein
VISERWRRAAEAEAGRRRWRPRADPISLFNGTWNQKDIKQYDRRNIFMWNTVSLCTTNGGLANAICTFGRKYLTNGNNISSFMSILTGCCAVRFVTFMLAGGRAPDRAVGRGARLCPLLLLKTVCWKVEYLKIIYYRSTIIYTLF